VVLASLAANLWIDRVRHVSAAHPAATVAAARPAVGPGEPVGAEAPGQLADRDRRLTLLQFREILLRRWLPTGDEAPTPKEAPL
jgi:hypothetical protein